MADYDELPRDMQEEIREVASHHKFPISIVTRYYLMGGKEHAELLCNLRDKGADEPAIQLVNDAIWDAKNKEYYHELLKSTSLWARIKRHLSKLFK